MLTRPQMRYVAMYSNKQLWQFFTIGCIMTVVIPPVFWYLGMKAGSMIEPFLKMVIM